MRTAVRTVLQALDEHPVASLAQAQVVPGGLGGAVAAWEQVVDCVVVHLEVGQLQPRAGPVGQVLDDAQHRQQRAAVRPRPATVCSGDGHHVHVKCACPCPRACPCKSACPCTSARPCQSVCCACAGEKRAAVLPRPGDGRARRPLRVDARLSTKKQRAGPWQLGGWLHRVASGPFSPSVLGWRGHTFQHSRVYGAPLRLCSTCSEPYIEYVFPVPVWP